VCVLQISDELYSSALLIDYNDQKWAVVAMDQFCKEMDGEVLSLANQNTSAKLT